MKIIEEATHLRDGFAGQAMAALLTGERYQNGWDYSVVAAEAYRQADAMLEYRKKYLP